MLRLASFILVTLAAALSLTGCDITPIANGGSGGGTGATGGSGGNAGGSGGGTTSSTTDTSSSTTGTTTDTMTTSSTTSTTSGSGASCESAGGNCVPNVPDACEIGMWSDQYSCSGADVRCCLPGPKECAAAGGVCEAVTPGACLDGMIADPMKFTCGSGVGTLCCLKSVCTPGMDQTCNANAAMNAFAGHCNPDGTCTCNPGYAKMPGGKCG
jgi:hypothetical protein